MGLKNRQEKFCQEPAPLRVNPTEDGRPPQPLTEKQLRFAEEFTLDFNATQAAIRAGYYEQSARVTGCRLMRKPEVKNKIHSILAREKFSYSILIESLHGLLLEFLTDEKSTVNEKIRAAKIIDKHKKLFEFNRFTPSIGSGLLNIPVTNQASDSHVVR